MACVSTAGRPGEIDFFISFFPPLSIVSTEHGDAAAQAEWAGSRWLLHPSGKSGQGIERGF